MKRLKNASVFLLTLLLGLCVISTPVVAENPWADDPLMKGKEEGDPPGPRGGPESEPNEVIDWAENFTISGLLIEVSYRLGEIWVDGHKVVPSHQDSTKGQKTCQQR